MDRYTINVKNTMMEIYRFRYEPVDSNMYFIPVGEEGFVLDPNINEAILPLFDKYGTKRIQIMLTHEHYDHTTGVEWLQEKMEAPIFCQERCAYSISSDKGNNPKFVALVLKNKDREDGGHRYEDFKANYKPYTLKADETYEERGIVRVSDVSFECFYTPGHSPGSTCYILDGKYVFTGDSLIQNTPTVLRFKTSNKEVFEQKTLPFLQSLDKNMLVFPGHGEPFKINEAKYL
jgi:glyoxylase-like metal-dependent hydrolase (beta-lactamase superfamily II)